MFSWSADLSTIVGVYVVLRCLQFWFRTTEHRVVRYAALVVIVATVILVADIWLSVARLQNSLPNVTVPTT